MKTVLVGGPPAVGKTSVVVHALAHVTAEPSRVLVAKFDSRDLVDLARYRSKGWEAQGSLSRDLCPDHHFVVELGEVHLDAEAREVELLVIETAGLCDRCSPYLERLPACTVLSYTGSLGAPARLEAMVTAADCIVMTRGELASQAEREVFRMMLRRQNPRAVILDVNGLTGEGAYELASWLDDAPHVELLDHERLRYPLPRGSCAHCSGGVT